MNRVHIVGQGYKTFSFPLQGPIGLFFINRTTDRGNQYNQLVVGTILESKDSTLQYMKDSGFTKFRLEFIYE